MYSRHLYSLARTLGATLLCMTALGMTPFGAGPAAAQPAFLRKPALEADAPGH
jgi:hypothetical protein